MNPVMVKTTFLSANDKPKPYNSVVAIAAANGKNAAVVQ
jgi:hypothetical protein